MCRLKCLAAFPASSAHFYSVGTFGFCFISNLLFDIPNTLTVV